MISKNLSFSPISLSCISISSIMSSFLDMKMKHHIILCLFNFILYFFNSPHLLYCTNSERDADFSVWHPLMMQNFKISTLSMHQRNHSGHLLYCNKFNHVKSLSLEYENEASHFVMYIKCIICLSPLPQSSIAISSKR